ncbi:ABC transporter permease [Candidatus Villigracilis affinis]|uniref:ABC transporter permease n=1 Tax=Candidatus Villigracilis affinis TaxID=3140682 RepID=UPI002A1EDD73|nr:ABC transporter permease [Anaerolineales bacterium]
MKKILLIGIALFFLVACGNQQIATQPAQALITIPSNDGEWGGTGLSQDGLSFTVKFTIRENHLAGIVYSFTGTDGISCTGIEYGHLDVADELAIVDDRFSAVLGDDLSIDASFSNLKSASGHMTIHWHDRQPRCNGDYEVDWKAEKAETQAGQAGQPRNPNAPNSFETFVQILVFGLSNGAVLALNAIGVTLIYGTVRTLNLAHGDVFALTTALVTSIINIIGIRENWPPLQLAGALFFVFLLAMSLGALLSVGVEILGFAPFRGASRLGPLIATLGLSFILFQGALVWRTYQGSWIPGEHRSVPGLPEVPTDGIPSFLPEINLVKYFGLPMNVIIRFSDVFVILSAVVLVALANWFIQKSRTGRAIRAVSQNQQAAQILGVNIGGTIRKAFAFGGAFAGAAGFIFALYYSRPFGSHGAQSGLFAFMTALLGGIGNPFGALVSGFLIGGLSSLSDYYLTAQWTPALLLLILILLFAWRPNGFTSDADGGETTVVRDSVILTAPVQGSSGRRWLVIALLVLFAFPLMFQGGQVILRLAGIFILLALGLNLALGVAGLLDLGFAASFGLSAYLTALLTAKFDITIALLLGAAMGAFFGWLKGGLARRLRSDFFAVATLAFGLLVRQVIINLEFTGGMGGIGGIAAPHILGFSLAGQMQRYYLVFFVIVLLAWISQQIISSRTGRAWMALSDDELAALSVGVDVNLARTQALMISSAMAGMAGVLYASTLSFVEPDLMAFHVSSMILTMVILGGAGSVPGALIGAVTIILYDKVFVPQLANWLALIWPVAIGSVPDIRGASFFNFGIALYLTVLIRSRRRS